MKFSIIIPIYNCEECVAKCLRSVLKQTYKDYELLVVCDSCTDGTEQIVRNLGIEPIVANVHNDGLARNIGLDNAQGEWVLFLDSDDWWLHEYVLQQIADKVEDLDADILAFSFIFKSVKYAAPRSNNGGLYPAVWNKCWKREFIGDTRFPNIYAESDWCFHLDNMEKNPKIVDWDMPMYYYNYMRPGSITYKVFKGEI